MSIETISAQFDVSVETVHTIIHEERKMRKICAKFVPRVLREDQKEICCHDSRKRVELINSDPAVLDALVPVMKAGSTAMTQRPRDTVPSGSMLALQDPRKSDSKSTHRLLMITFFDSTGMIYMHWVPTGQSVNKEYYVEVLREFRKRFCWRGQHSSNRISGISTRTMHQSTTPSLSQTIWPRWASRQFLALPIVQTLLPVTFGYSLSSEAVVMRQLRRWKRLWWRSLTRFT